jgi:hypothetical protein
VPLVDQRAHLPIERRSAAAYDVRPVDVGVGHDQDCAVAQLRDVELVLADAGAERGDDRLIPRGRASCRSAPSRRSGSCRAAAGSLGTPSRPCLPIRPPIALDR